MCQILSKEFIKASGFLLPSFFLIFLAIKKQNKGSYQKQGRSYEVSNEKGNNIQGKVTNIRNSSHTNKYYPKPCKNKTNYTEIFLPVMVVNTLPKFDW